MPLPISQNKFCLSKIFVNIKYYFLCAEKVSKSFISLALSGEITDPAIGAEILS